MIVDIPDPKKEIYKDKIIIGKSVNKLTALQLDSASTAFTNWRRTQHLPSNLHECCTKRKETDEDRSIGEKNNENWLINRRDLGIFNTESPRFLAPLFTCFCCDLDDRFFGINLLGCPQGLLICLYK